MDLGCIDMGCVEKPRKETSLEKDSNSPKESVMSASKSGKNNKAKDVVRSSLNALNRLTSQISKPPHRKTSPMNWFPRKKVEPYLKRKIKMLQEVDGMHSTLDETLGDSNPHYSRVLREKIAIREAAEIAMEARKAAMIEASWCRMLQAARIGSIEAEAQLAKAEHSAAEAFEAARAVGVIMNDAQNHYRIETSSAKGGSTTTHTVLATFETAFEVDKQVAGAVKVAFIKLANCPSIDKNEFKELLRKISENPETDEHYNNDTSDFTSECESDVGSDKFSMSNIVDMMLGRLRCLNEDELASLTTIVATSGLNAALAETGNSKRRSLSSAVEHTENSCLKAPNRVSVGGRSARISSSDVEIPSLDKFLVKHLTRLEREVLEAKNARKSEAFDGNEKKLDNITNDEKLKEGIAIPDLGSVLVKHSSKLEKEVEEARMNNWKSSKIDKKRFQRGARTVGRAKQDAEEVPSLDKFLVKRLTRLEREVEEARNGKKSEPIKTTATSLADAKGKENTDLNKTDNGNIGLNILHKDDGAISNYYESLDKVLVKHVSRLEKEKLDFCADEKMRTRPKRKDACRELESSLDQVLVKHKSRLEREKTAAVEQQDEDSSTRHSVSRRQARERELQAAWGGLSLGNSMRPHVSRLQRDKAAWIKAEEEERERAVEEEEV